MARTNEHGQPIGEPLPAGWMPPPAPSAVTLEGAFVRVEPLDPPAHARDLFEAGRADPTGASWTYLPDGPFESLDSFTGWLSGAAPGRDRLPFAFVDKTSDRALGFGSYLRIYPTAGSIEIGYIWLSPLLQRTPMSTEAMHLLMAHAFELGYRRYEWKCDALNAPSRRAAERLGFTFEGIFRQAIHYKGRNRDTAWYSITDDEWPAIREAQRAWLRPENFDADGRQRRSLETLRRHDNHA